MSCAAVVSAAATVAGEQVMSVPQGTGYLPCRVPHPGPWTPIVSRANPLPPSLEQRPGAALQTPGRHPKETFGTLATNNHCLQRLTSISP